MKLGHYPDDRPSAMAFPAASFVVLLLFVGSGAAALTYEIVWQQLLQLVIGSSTVSVGVLLATFMGGMCLGSWFAPRLVSRQRHPLRVYAALELGIGVAGLLMLVAMPLVTSVYVAWGGNGTFGLFFRGLLSAICLLPPTFAMGATLPIISRWAAGPRFESGHVIGSFYAGNIVGAVLGSLLAGFYLLRVFDMNVATYVAVAINVVVAAAAWRLARSRQPLAPNPQSLAASLQSVEPGPEPLARSLQPLIRSPQARCVFICVGLSGFCALSAEVIWTRMLSLIFSATVYTFSIILAVFLIALGIGSGIGAWLTRRINRPRIALGWCQLASVAAMAWSAHMLAQSLPFWPINVALAKNIWFNFQLDFARTTWAILPAPIFWGASFPLALAALADDREDPGRLVGRVYAANTLGAIVGALATSVILIAWFGTRQAERAMLAIAIVSSLLVLIPGSSKATRLSAAVAVFAAMILVALIPPVPSVLVAYGRNSAAWAGHTGEMLYVGEGMHASVAVSRVEGGVLNYHNAGKIQASSQPPDMRLQRMLGHLTTIVPRAARSVLVIGCGAGVTAGAVSVNPGVERVTIVEIEPLVPQVAGKYFGSVNHNVLKNPRVRVIVDDARHYLMTTKEKFDAITSDPLDPWVKGAATLYTKEFFDSAREHLNPGGVMTLFVQLYESSEQAVKSEVATFFNTFPNGLVFGNTYDGQAIDTVLVGQVDPPEIYIDYIDQALRSAPSAAVAQSLGEIGFFTASDLFATYAGRARDLKPWLADAQINRDRNLRLQYLAGLGVNLHAGDVIYREMLKYRVFPDDVFIASGGTLDWLRELMTGVRE